MVKTKSVAPIKEPFPMKISLMPSRVGVKALGINHSTKGMMSINCTAVSRQPLVADTIWTICCNPVSLKVKEGLACVDVP